MAPDGKGTEHIEYRCTSCGIETNREDLTVKRVSFQTMGVRFKMLKSRNRAWLCQSCLEQDDDWNAPKFATAPGMTKTRIGPNPPPPKPKPPRPVLPPREPHCHCDAFDGFHPLAACTEKVLGGTS